jgi:hypothetical protein
MHFLFFTFTLIKIYFKLKDTLAISKFKLGSFVF